MTNDFHTRVECVIINKNKTTDIHEYFDATNNRGFIEQVDTGLRFDALYSYDTNEFITFFPDSLSKYCCLHSVVGSKCIVGVGVNVWQRTEKDHVF